MRCKEVHWPSHAWINHKLYPPFRSVLSRPLYEIFKEGKWHRQDLNNEIKFCTFFSNNLDCNSSSRSCFYHLLNITFYFRRVFATKPYWLLHFAVIVINLCPFHKVGWSLRRGRFRFRHVGTWWLYVAILTRIFSLWNVILTFHGSFKHV